MEHLINPNLLKEMEDKAARIYTDPYFDDALRFKFMKSQMQESLYASSRLEQNLRRINREDCGREMEVAEGIRQSMESAWEWGCQNFAGSVDFSFVLDLGNKVLSYMNTYVPIRRDGITRLKGLRHMPPSSSEKIEREMSAYLANVNSTEDPVERAAYSHLMIYSIQPFPDGNKRLARTMQNLMLWGAHRPPVIISEGELAFYMNLINNAYESYRERVASGEHEVSNPELVFYGYIASKANASLDTVLHQLTQKKKLKVRVASRGNEKKARINAKKVLINMVKARDSNGVVRGIKGEDCCFLVVGDVSDREIYKVLSRVNDITEISVSPFVKPKP